ncbi:strawberry notch family protein [Sphingomonas sp. CGMCC 1.13654]|uniref:Strawberry notch family protein n=1 Tax=Sphingomonas chungangi TaxID=2683589 RepID=A0A838L6G3_9SPHN|nr:strawberry notch family protein [Sphingomonas chungangi]MBA2934637.1 strawberry notch family protein [Sphingomonas chungangi]MVW57672.1 methylase [Sphingomonas chungangi]
MTQPMLAFDAAASTDAPSPLLDVAREIAGLLRVGCPISRKTLARLMTRAFGGSDAEGAWSMRQAYDALEAAQVMLVRDPDWPALASDDAEAFGHLRGIERSLPTQSYRTERQVDLQQFSTPISLAWLAAQAARITADDIVLEPSAGTGMLAAHAARAGATCQLNERDPDRAALLSRLLGTAVTRHDAEYIAVHMAGAPTPTVVLINPPFGRSEGRGRDRHAGARHLRSALEPLMPGGRCVAIMSPGFAANGTGASGYASVCEVARPRVEIDIQGRPYAKHGTSIDVRLVVFDKGWTGETLRFVFGGIDDALARVLDLPERLPLGPSSPPPPTTAARASLQQRGGGLLAGTERRALAAPRRILPDDEVVSVAYSTRDDIAPLGEPVGIYVPWRLARIDIAGARPHPDRLVESIAMASVPPAAPTYRPSLPRRAFDALSEAQLEAVILAGDAFERDLPGRFQPNYAGDMLTESADGDAYRAGFFIGDGTGVGKGREVAACIMDQWCRGRRRAVWISKSAALVEDARRDWSALGGLAIDIQPLDAFPFGQPITMASGILFLTYATLRSQRHDTRSRLQQILEWLGPDHDGMIVFDEAHAMANAAGTETEFGSARGSDQGLAGVRLQNALPRARILYVSATGATDPSNLCYASRLGLWGPETAFGTRETFMAAMTAGGIAAMEIVARDLKAMGLYLARALSFKGVEYERLEHRLTAEQIALYDIYADGWATIHANLDEALRAANIVDRMNGDTLNGQALGAALSRFESAKQRFFSQLLVAMKIPSLIQAITDEVAAGHSAVVQLVTTAEAVLDRRLAELGPEDRANLDLELSPREYMIDYLRAAFPIRQMRVFKDAAGTTRSELMLDEQGDMVICEQAVRMRDDLVEQLCALPPIPTALDALIAHFGKDMVAEVTGRSRRIVPGSKGEQVLERRSASANLAEASAFMDGRKSILAFSDAGGTGRSYHADRDAGSAMRRRIHFLLEPGWRAAAAIQGLGRTHRTNQLTAPVFRPVTTDCKGERRFISTIARRLDSLGALTRGQRQTGGQNLFDPADNLESDYAKEALNRWYHLLAAGKLASTTLTDFMAATGLKLIDKESGMLLERLPPIQRWLNRILALRIATQNAIFDEYLGLIQARVDAARDAGTLDVGVEMIMAESIEVLEDHLLRTDPRTGASTRLQRLELELRPHVTSYDRLTGVWGDEVGLVRLHNTRSGQVALQVSSWPVTDPDGHMVPMVRLIRPTGNQRVALASLATSHWTVIDEQRFASVWTEQAAEAARRLEIETVHVVTGLLLPVWSSLPDDDVRVWRLGTPRGQDLLARIVPHSSVPKLLDLFGISSDAKLSPEETIAAASQGSGVALRGLDGARLLEVRLNDQRRLEIRGFPVDRLSWLKSIGCFTEIIVFRTRLFLPIDRASDILAMIEATTT